jgi:hypothetical protein
MGCPSAHYGHISVGVFYTTALNGGGCLVAYTSNDRCLFTLVAEGYLNYVPGGLQEGDVLVAAFHGLNRAKPGPMVIPLDGEWEQVLSVESPSVDPTSTYPPWDVPNTPAPHAFKVEVWVHVITVDDLARETGDTSGAQASGIPFQFSVEASGFTTNAMPIFRNIQTGHPDGWYTSVAETFGPGEVVGDTRYTTINPLTDFAWPYQRDDYMIVMTTGRGVYDCYGAGYFEPWIPSAFFYADDTDYTSDVQVFYDEYVDPSMRIGKHTVGYPASSMTWGRYDPGARACYPSPVRDNIYADVPGPFYDTVNTAILLRGCPAGGVYLGKEVAQGGGPA